TRKIYANLKDAQEVLEIGMNRAVELLAQKAARGANGGRNAEPLKALGEHPDGGAVNVMAGRYGPYVKWEKINATLPKDLDPADVTLEKALELIEAKRAARGGKGKARKPAGGRKAAGTKTARAKTARKPAEPDALIDEDGA
ncbi:MAG: DNA topoisomerase I, partial [Alphaproteobacteria bacterium]